MPLIAVVDVETTGLYPSVDRVVELAAVILDEDGATIREFSTLVNPERDVGPSRIHRISASDVMRAPRFSGMIGELLSHLRGVRALAGHNVRFDRDFLAREFERVGLSFPEVATFCTMRNSGGGRLEECCERFGVQVQGPLHSALADARASAALLKFFLKRIPSLAGQIAACPTVDWPISPAAPEPLLRRGELPSRFEVQPDFLCRIVNRCAVFPAEGAAANATFEYDEVLCRAIADRHIDEVEGQSLVDLAERLGLTVNQVAEIHQFRIRNLARIALQDGSISQAEHRDLVAVGRLLGVDERSVAQIEVDEASGPTASRAESSADRISNSARFAGRTVCFTGQSVCTVKGQPLTRELAELFAREAGVEVAKGVTKKLDYLIVTDALTQSGKAKKARERGVPVVHESVFWSEIGVCLD